MIVFYTPPFIAFFSLHLNNNIAYYFIVKDNYCINLSFSFSFFQVICYMHKMFWLTFIWSTYPHTSNLRLNCLKVLFQKKVWHWNINARIFHCKEWFDFDCKQKITRLLDKSLDLQSRLTMIKLYIYLLKIKTQTFFGRKQKSLTRELLRNPKFICKQLTVWVLKLFVIPSFWFILLIILIYVPTLHLCHVVKE